MKNLLPLLFIIAFCNSQAQVIYPYDFSGHTSTYQDLVSPTELLPTDIWDDTILTVPIGFKLKWMYDNKEIDTVYLDTYGFLRTSITDTFLYGFWPRSGMAPYFADLCDRSFNDSTLTTPQSSVSYKTEGIAGSRICKIQFKNAGFYGDSTMQDYVNFQIWLHEANDIIEFHYGPREIADAETVFGPDGGPWIGMVYKSTLTLNSSFMITALSLDSCSYISGDSSTYAVNTPPPVDFFAAGPPSNFYFVDYPSNGQLFRWTPKFLTTIQEPLGVNIKVYPTLFDNYVMIDGLEDATVQVIDMSGKLLRSAQILGQHRLDMTNMATGNYNLRILSKGLSHTVKIQKK